MAQPPKNWKKASELPVATEVADNDILVGIVKGDSAQVPVAALSRGNVQIKDLADPDKGAAMVARGVVAVDSIADLLALPEGQRKEGLLYLVKAYFADSDIGSACYFYAPSASRGWHNGVTHIDPTHLAELDSPDFLVPENAGVGLFEMFSGSFVRTFPVKVGLGCAFETVNSALSYLSDKRPAYVEAGFLSEYPRGVRAEIVLASGFVMAEQVLVQGTDLSHIAITSEDHEVVIDRSSLSNVFSGRFPAFGANNSATLPLIEALFVMDASGTATDRDGIFLVNKSTAYVRTGCGVKSAGSRGFHVSNSSIGHARGADFSGAGTFGARVSNSSFGSLRSANLSGALQNGIALSDAKVDMQEADISGCGSSGIFAQGGEILATNANISGCQHSNTTGYFGAVNAEIGAKVVCHGADISNSGYDAIVCNEAEVIACQASVIGRVANLSSAARHAISTVGGIVRADRANMASAGSTAIIASNNAVVSAERATLDGAASGAVRASGGARVNVARAQALSITGASALLAETGAEIAADNINMPNTSSNPIAAFSGSRVSAAYATCNGGGAPLYCGGAFVSIRGANVRRGENDGNDMQIQYGGIIQAAGVTGGSTSAFNTLSADGVIFK